MDKLYKEKLSKLETSINELEIQVDCPIKRIETIISLIIKCLSEIKEYVLQKGLFPANP